MMFKVTIIETLKRTVTVEADNRDDAEQMVSDDWHNSKYVLDSGDYTGVRFEVKVTSDVKEGDDDGT